MKKQKNRSSVPRNKRLKRSSRLQAAKCWIPKYEGKNLVKAYSKHFAVDKLCAVKELTLLGYEINYEYVEQLKQSIEIQIQLNQKRKELKKELMEENLWDEIDEEFDDYYEELPF